MSCVESYEDSLSRAFETEQLVALQKKVEKDIADRRAELADRLNENISIHGHHLSQSLSLVQTHSQISSKSEEIHHEIQRIEPSLKQDVETYKEHIQDYEQAKLEREAKTLLDTVHLSLSTFSRYIDSNEYAKAARYLQHDVKSTFENLERSFVSRWSGSAALQTEYHRLSARLEENLMSAWTESTRCTPSTLTLKKMHNNRPLSDLIEALEALNSFSSRYRDLYNNVKQYYIDVLLPSSTTSGILPTVLVNEDTLTLQQSAEAPIKSTQLTSLSTALSFINERYEEFGKHITPLVLERLMGAYLLPSLPDRLDGPDVTLFTRKVGEYAAFEKQVSHDSLIEKVSQTWGDHWIEKRQTRALKDARSVILRPNWDMFVAEIDVLVEAISTGKDEASEGAHQVEAVQKVVESEIEPATPYKQAETPKNHVDVADDDDEDGWGLDEDEEIREEPAVIQKVDSRTSITSLRDTTQQDDDEDEDAWGLDDDDNVEQLQDESVQSKQEERPDLSRTTSRSSITSPQPDASVNDDDDGWGLDDDDEEPMQPDQKAQEARDVVPLDDDDPWNEDAREDDAAPPAKADIASEDGWGLDDDEPVEVEETQAGDSKADNLAHTHIPQARAPARQTLEKRSTVVSAYVKQLIGLVDDVYRDRTYLMQADDIPSSNSDLSSQATAVADSVIDIYRCLFPHVHKETLQLVPALALQFANDCEYLSHQASQRHLSTSSTKLEKLNKSIVVGVDVEQRRQLVDLLTDAGPLTDLSISHERAFAGVISTFSRLRSTVKGVISIDQLNQLLGSIAEFVMRFIIEAVEDLDDISEEDSNKLCKVCRELQAGLQGVFEENGTQGFKHTSNWFKFAYLSEILQANLVDLSYLHQEGSLMDFSADELVRLCKALFADTDKRASVIDNFIAAGAR